MQTTITTTIGAGLGLAAAPLTFAIVGLPPVGPVASSFVVAGLGAVSSFLFGAKNGGDDDGGQTPQNPPADDHGEQRPQDPPADDHGE